MPGVLHNLSIQTGNLRATKPDTWTDQKQLASANTAEAFAVPTWTTSTGASVYAANVVFGASGNFCTRFNALPGGTAANFADTNDGTGCEINPEGAWMTGVQEISVKVTTDGTAVSATFYK